MNEGLVYRRLQPGDAEDYRRLRLECLRNDPGSFGSSYEEESSRPRLAFERCILEQSSDCFMVGAFDGDVLVGITGFRRGDRLKTRHRGEIVQMYVHSSHRSGGVGERLLRFAVEVAFSLNGVEQLELAVIAGNVPAIRLYEKIGFEKYGELKKYFKKDGRYWDQMFMTLGKLRYTTGSARTSSR